MSLRVSSIGGTGTDDGREFGYIMLGALRGREGASGKEPSYWTEAVIGSPTTVQGFGEDVAPLCLDFLEVQVAEWWSRVE